MFLKWLKQHICTKLFWDMTNLECSETSLAKSGLLIFYCQKGWGLSLKYYITGSVKYPPSVSHGHCTIKGNRRWLPSQRTLFITFCIVLRQLGRVFLPEMPYVTAGKKEKCAKYIFRYTILVEVEVEVEVFSIYKLVKTEKTVSEVKQSSGKYCSSMLYSGCCGSA